MSLSSKVPSLGDIESGLPAERPPLHAIAAMPFPTSMVAMRRFYNKDWHRPEPDGKTPAKWKVTVSYTYREEDCFTTEVEAMDREEAEARAEEAFDKSGQSRWADDVEVTDVEAECLGEAAQ